MVSRIFSIMLIASLVGVQIADARVLQQATPSPQQSDVDEIIAYYSKAQVSLLQQWSRSTRPISSKLCGAVIHNLPWKRYENPELEANLKTILNPLFIEYGKSYSIFLINTSKPSILIDSDCVLVITTGLLQRLQNDDELLGFTAHEIAHSLFASRSAAAKELLDRDKEALTELSRIELECDAVATLTLAAMGRDPTQFIKSIERVNKDYPKETSTESWYPSPSTRLLVVTGLMEGNVEPKVSKLLEKVHGLVDIK